MVDTERVVSTELVSVADADAEPVGVTVGRGARVTVCVTVSVTVGRRLTLPHDVEVAERVVGPVAEPEAVLVSVKEAFGVPVVVWERGAVGVSARQRVGVAEVVCVLDCEELRVSVGLVLRDRDCAGDDVPVLEGAMLRVKVPDAVGDLDPAPLRVPVEDTVDVFD